MMIARFVCGIGTGIETSTVPMYQSELCEAEKRGRLVASEPLFVGLGIEIAYWFDYGMSFTEGSIAWRLPIACQMIFAIVSACFYSSPQGTRLIQRLLMHSCVVRDLASLRSPRIPSVSL